MDADRHQFQFSIRHLLEIVFWISTGIVAFKMAGFRLSRFGSLEFEQPESILSFALLFYPGVAFGAAAGVSVGRRAVMMWGGLIWWPVVLFFLFVAAS